MYFFFFSQSSEISPLKVWAFANVFSSMNDCLSQCSPGAPWCQSPSDWSRSAVGIKFSLIASCMRGWWVSSWGPWHIVLDTTAPSKELLSMGEDWICVVGDGGQKTRDILCCHDVDVTSDYNLVFQHPYFCGFLPVSSSFLQNQLEGKYFHTRKKRIKSYNCNKERKD